jgi:hypothetical protein
LAVGFWLLAFGCWLLAVGFWVLAIGYWLSSIGYWLSPSAKLATEGFWEEELQAFRRISGLVLATAVVATLVTGCETGRDNKRHAEFNHVNDVTTTGHPQPALAANAEGEPPVPDSPTAAGVDGKQPYNDGDARSTTGVEGGHAAAPNHNHAEAFQRQ